MSHEDSTKGGIKFYASVEFMHLGYGLKWRRGKVKTIALPREHLEQALLEFSEDGYIELDVSKVSGLFMDLDRYSRGATSEELEELVESQEELLIARAEGKVN